MGKWLGYGRGADNGEQAWDSFQQGNVTDCVKGGLREFYFAANYEWSFLKPVTTLTLASGATTVTLPFDLAGVEGKLLVQASDGTTTGTPLEYGPIGRVLAAEVQYPDTTGWPELACTEALKGTSAQHPQRQQIRIWPAADQAYTLTVRYYLIPAYLSGDRPYAYGGTQHAQTLLAACKAVAERDFDDTHEGPQMLAYMRLLEASKDMDRRLKPQTFGANRDNSDDARAGMRWPRDWRGQTVVTVEGVAYP